MADDWTAGDVFDAIARRYAQPEWIVLPEVRNATGFRQRVRYADAIAMNMYPSRGLQIHGFEIKIRRSDWLKELKTPDKADEIGRYCDQWWIVAPAGVINDGEVPAAWGWYEARKRGLFVMKKPAPIHKIEPVNRAFVASLLRGATCMVDRVRREVQAPGDKALSEKWQEGWDEGKENEKRATSHMRNRCKELQELVDTFQARTGIKFSQYDPPERIAAAFKVAEKLVAPYSPLRTLHLALGELLNVAPAPTEDDDG